MAPETQALDVKQKDTCIFFRPPMNFELHFLFSNWCLSAGRRRAVIACVVVVLGTVFSAHFEMFSCFVCCYFSCPIDIQASK